MNTSFILGIDPSKPFFTATLMRSTGERIWKGRQFDMSRDGFNALQDNLPEGDLTVGIEASGRIDDNLLAWFGNWKSSHSRRKTKLIRINPGQSARFGGPKPRRNQTDRSDSDHLAEYARVYAHRLEAFEQDPTVQAMARLISERQHLVDDLAATKNRIHEQLLVCFPEFTQIFLDPFAKLARAVLREVPTARHATSRRPLSLARVKAGRKERSLGTEQAQKLIELGKRSIASAGERNDGEAMVFLLDQLALIEKRLATIEQTLASFAARAAAEVESPGAEGVSPARQIGLLDSIPGIGTVAAATLVLGSGGIGRFHGGSALAAQWATCPEHIQTGTSLDKTRLTARGDHKRRAMLYLATQIACMYDPAFAFHKWRMIQRGLCPQQAVCAAMNRMAHVIWALVAKNRSYDVNAMIDQIQIHHGQLWKTFVRLHQNNSALWKKAVLKHKEIA
jgi:transposase